jgi:hypothetical protein
MPRGVSRFPFWVPAMIKRIAAGLPSTIVIMCQ